MKTIMKKFAKISLAVVMTALIIVVSCLPAFAAKSKADVVLNGKAEASKGDTITYTLKLSDCDDKLEGIQMYIFYNKQFLELDTDSVKVPELKGAVINPKFEKGIAFNWTSVTDLVNFKKAKTLITMDFKVKNPCQTSVTYFIADMYGEDMTYFKTYKLTHDILVNGKEAVKDGTPMLCPNNESVNQYQGSFVNYKDGMGEKNGSGKDHVAVTGGATSPAAAQAATDAATVTQDGGNMTTVLVILGIVFAIIAIIVVVVLRRHFNKDADAEDKE